MIREAKNKLKSLYKVADLPSKIVIWLGISFIASIIVSIWILIASHIKFPTSWDFLAFCGSIIGGAITWFGVKRTLNHERRLRFLDRYDIEMREISLFIEDIRFIINANFVAEITYETLKKNGMDEYSAKMNMLVELGKQIELFLNRVEKRYPDLIGRIDWNVIIKLDMYLKLMQDFKYHYKYIQTYFINDELDKISQVFTSIDEALSIYQLIENHKEKITNIYNIEKDIHKK
ncbi:hypothetical protein [Paenibacillus sp. BR1-192]|uniref:hypothetical protein n=1 Tax=Paenibacillus sp. BR1-192 TaxID=3032287 RepID=UPI00240D65D4|nr:hypothetical protein [Paenibacillus sp. BR1-192]WFB59039.1 hypothetical protein P0X86_01995 [Paenibacillus sp. BR1-192]